MGEDYKMAYYQQRLVPGNSLYDQAHLKRLYDQDVINSQFIHSIFCEEYEKNMIGNLCQKKVMNGQVPSIFDLKEQERVEEEAAALTNTFYNGEKLTAFEHDVERMYISEKLDKFQKYKQRKSFRFKVRWTTSDFNRFQDQKNYRMNDPEYFGLTKPEFSPFDLDNALACMHVHQDIQKTSKLRRMMTYFTDTKVFERGHKRSLM